MKKSSKTPAKDTPTIQGDSQTKWQAFRDYAFVALVFFIVHAIVQFSTPFFADTNDSFYHAKMGEMIIGGITQQFPWLFFTTLHEQFVNHHLLFHMMLWPFIQIGNIFHALGGTSLPGIFFGPKFMITIAITSLFVMAYRLLREEGIRFQWIWLLFLLCLPYDFFFRMHMIRAQSVSLLLMLAGLWALWNKRFVLLGILSFAYVWLYGGFFFLPIFVITYVTAQYILEKKFDLRPLYWSVGGVALGFLLNPYFPKNIEFLYRQIFETGLGYQINVGGEWKPYDTWYMFQMGIIVFGLHIGSIIWTILKGIKQNARSITLLVISFFFLILMWKSKRFVEYWPFFAVLSSAYLLKDYIKTMYVNRIRVTSVFVALLSVYLIISMYWGKLAVPSITWFAESIPKPLMGTVLVLLVFIAIIGAMYSYMTISQQQAPAKKVFHEFIIGFLLVLLPVYGLGGMDAVRADIRPQLAYVRGAEDIMKCVLEKGQAQKGDIVFTDDWDIFPLFFFYNTVNNYIVGLDPVFMDAFNRPLYKEFAAITMGNDSEGLYEKITQDFQASFVVMDKDHTSMRRNIDATEGFEELCDNGTFSAYKVVEKG